MKLSSPIKSVVLGLVLSSGPFASAAINFQFTYTGSGGFSDASEGSARQAALQNAANVLSGYFITGTNVTLTFEVESRSENTNNLASAGSPVYTPVGGSGFFKTVVQKKAQGGPDDNAGGYDGEVSWNWYHAWSVGPTVPSGQFDMKSVAMHELLHAMGFFSFIDAPGNNASNTVWSTFDSFLVNSSGVALISPTGVWQGYDSALTNGGLFFNGPNAVAANGGAMVPIYSPSSWESGSSGSHIANSVGTLIMNAAVNSGPGVESLSAVELGILRDIGYNVIPEPASTLLLTAGLTLTVVFRRRLS